MEHKVKAHMLRAEGLSSKSIGAVLGVTYQAVAGWFRHGTAQGEYEARLASDSLPALTAAERAEADAQLARQGGRRDTGSAAAEHGARKAGAVEAAGRVLQLHKPDDVVGPLVTAQQRAEFAAAAGYAFRLRWCLIDAGLKRSTADHWAALCAMEAPEASALMDLYEQARMAGARRRRRSIDDGEGAPATAWQVVLRLDADLLVDAGESGDVDPLADEPDAALLAGLDAATAELREAQ